MKSVSLRYKLIRALIETVRDFQRIQHCKIVIALRQDLLDRVFRHTRDSGFQEEKYDSLILRIQWDKHGLIEVLDKRIQHLVSRQYTKQAVTHKDFLPRKIGGEEISEWIVQRTLWLPRDVINFFNACLEQGVNKQRLTLNLLRAAEGVYSERRFRAIGDEWYTEFPNVLEYALTFLKGRRAAFKVGTIEKDGEWGEGFLSHALRSGPGDELHAAALDFMADRRTLAEAVAIVLKVFAKTGLIGLKLASYEGVSWSFRGQKTGVLSEIDADTSVQICPAFYRVLGIPPR